MNRNDVIYVAGHRGLAGSAIVRALQAEGFDRLLTRTSRELDLTRQADVEAFFDRQRVDYVFLAAGKVGGIHANNTLRAEFIYKNLMIAANVIHAAWRHGVKRLLFLGSSCIYPRDCPQPMKEEYLLTGPLEHTNEPYALSKIAGLKLCESYNLQYGTNYVSLMPTNLYGSHDNFDLEGAHVLPALLRKAHEAKMRGEKVLRVWGSGRPFREFLHADDLGRACVAVMRNPAAAGLINVGSGQEVSIRELAELICRTVGFTGQVEFDASRPDGTPRKLLDSSRILSFGWKPGLNLAEGLALTYRWYCEQPFAAAA
jgi:GDP-L-fucose synthase